MATSVQLSLLLLEILIKFCFSSGKDFTAIGFGRVFNLPPGLTTSSIRNHNQIVACKIGANSNDLVLNDSSIQFEGTLCTHLIYSHCKHEEKIFRSIKIPSNDCNDEDGLILVSNFTSKYQNLKTLIEVDVSPKVWKRKQNRKKFILNMKARIRKFKLHGLSLVNTVYKERDGYDFTVFAKELQYEFVKENLLIGIEILLDSSKRIREDYKTIAEISRIFDFVWARGFNFHPSSEKTTGHNAPLYGAHTSIENIYDNLILLLLEKRVNPKSLVLSVPLFASLHKLKDNEDHNIFGFNSSTDGAGFFGPTNFKLTEWAYPKICLVLSDRLSIFRYSFPSEKWRVYWDKEAKVPFMTLDKLWISFENFDSISEKVKLASNLGLGGILGYTVNSDDFQGSCSDVKFPFLRAINYALQNNENTHGSLLCTLIDKVSNQTSRPLAMMEFSVNPVVGPNVDNKRAPINCLAYGNPETTISWFQKSGGTYNELQTEDTEAINRQLDCGSCIINVTVFSSKLNITLDENVEGWYCRAENAAGKANSPMLSNLFEERVRENGSAWIKDITPTTINLPTAAKTPSTTNENHDRVVACKLDPASQLERKNTGFNFSNLGLVFDGSLCTHVIYSFCLINKTDINDPGCSDDKLETLSKVMSKYDNLKILIEVQFAIWKFFWKDQSERFIPTISKLIRKFGFHGISLPYQSFKDSKGYNFMIFATKLKKNFKKHNLLIGMEISIYSRERIEKYKRVVDISRTFDFVWARAYNFNEKSEKITGHNTPLYSSGEHIENIYDNLKMLLFEKRVNPKTLILSIPLYAVSHVMDEVADADNDFGYSSSTNGEGYPAPSNNDTTYWSYREVCLSSVASQSFPQSLSLEPNGKWKTYWDNIAKVPFMTRDNVWISYDNPESVGEKVKLVNKLGLGGVLVDRINQDDFGGECSNVKYPVMRSIHYVFGANKNEYGSLYCSLSKKALHQRYVPVAILEPDEIMDNDNATQVNCIVYGYPKPEIKWHKKTAGTNTEFQTEIKAVQMETFHTSSCIVNAEVYHLKTNITTGVNTVELYCTAENVLGSSKSLSQFASPKAVYFNGKTWIEKIKSDAVLTEKVKTYSTTNHSDVVFCKVFLWGRNRNDDDKYDLSDPSTNFDGNLCTHIIYSYFLLTKDFKIEDSDSLAAVKDYRDSVMSNFPHLKTLLDITISSLDDTEKKSLIRSLIVSPKNKDLFIKNMITNLRELNISGLYLGYVFHEHIDNINHNEQEFITFLKETKREFEKVGLLLTTEIDLHNRELMANSTFHSVVQLSRILDFVFLKGFDFHNTGDGIAGHCAPLYRLQDDDENINDNLKFLLYNLGANPETLILAIPFFGQPHELNDAYAPFFGLNSSTNYLGFKGPVLGDLGLWAYNAICLKEWDTFWDFRAMVPFKKSGKYLISFDNPESVYEKVKLANGYGLRGVMAQSIDVDDFRGKCKGVNYTLLRTINYALNDTNHNKKDILCHLKNESLPLSPIVSVDNYIYYVTKNYDIEIHCSADGNPCPNITWHKDTVEIKGGIKNYETKIDGCMPYSRTTSTLRIRNFGTNDEGKYLCKGTNSEGSTNISFFLTFNENPFIVAEDSIWIEKIKDDAIFPFPFKNAPEDDYIDVPIFCIFDPKARRIDSSNENLLSNINYIIDEGLCSHFVYSKFDIKGFSYDISISDLDRKQLSQLVNATSTNPKCKIILGVTIENLWSKSGFIKKLANSQKNMKKFKQNMKKYVEQLNLHGLYLDFSFSANAEVTTFTKFSQELKREFHKMLLVTQIHHAVSKESGTKCSSGGNALLSGISEIYDFVFVNGYKFRETQEKVAEHNSPIRTLEDSNVNLYSYLNSLLYENDIAVRKVVLVLPFFGTPYKLVDENASQYGFQANASDDSFAGPLFNSTDFWGYNEICKTVLNNQSWKIYWDYVASAPFAKQNNFWITFDDPRSIYNKTNISTTGHFKLGGIAVNSLNFDDYEGHCGNIKYPLLRAIKNALIKVDTTTILMSHNSLGWIIAVVVLFILLGLATLYLIDIRRQNKGLTRKEIKHFKKGIPEALSVTNVDDHPNNRPYDVSYELKNNFEIDKLDVLGSGAFGVVYRGKVNGSPVAVKCIKPGADKHYLKSLLSEIKILIYLREHRNIVNVVGANTAELTKGVASLFIELCPLGNLQNYLRRPDLKFKGNNPDEILYEVFYYSDIEPENEGKDEMDKTVTLWSLVNWSYQICNGLQYLSSKKIIHGDLAARNVLLFEKDTVKLTDFGLSRKLYLYDYYEMKNQKDPLPWRWMAIEALKYRKFSIQSDIWSFGITAWEIFSLGEIPYQSLTYDELKLELDDGIRIQIPKYATDEIYQFMLQCWQENPNERPTPEDATAYFSNLAMTMLNDNSL